MKFAIPAFLLLCVSFFAADVVAQEFTGNAVQLPTQSNTHIHSDGTFFQTGSFIDSPDFDQDSEPDFTSRGGSDIFISSHAADGSLNWVIAAGGTAASETVNEAGGGTVVGNGKLYVAGTYDGAADFDEDEVDDITSAVPETSRLFIAQYELDGTFNWVKPIGDLDGFVNGLVFSDNSNLLYLAATQLDEAGNTEGTGVMHAVALDTEGVVQWTSSTAIDGTPTTGNVQANDLLVDDQGQLHLSGAFRGNVDFDGDGPLDPVAAGSTQFGPQARAYVAQYSASGTINWIDYAGGTGSSFANSIDLDATGDLYVAGSYGLGNVIFENTEATYTGPEPADNMFLARYNATGEVQWAVFPNALVDFFIFSGVYGNAVAVCPNEEIVYVGGYLTGSVDFDGNGQYEVNTFSFPAYTAVYTKDGINGSNWTAGADASIHQIIPTGPEMFKVLGDFNTSIDFDGTGGEPAMDVFGGSGRGYFVADFTRVGDPIPVELTSFEATANGSAASLKWATASETNNAGFEVLQDGQSITFIEGAGTTNEPQTYAHHINNLPAGTYTFQLKQIDFDGAFELSNEAQLTIDLTGAYQLGKAFPNPFNPQTTFSLSIARGQDVQITLFDMLGRQVQTLHNGFLEANTQHRFTIDGSGLASGTYFYNVRGHQFTASEHITLMK
ncbi:MAG: T9SS type A sorting domain-containing protein [Bacteroidota bacterium]